MICFLALLWDAVLGFLLWKTLFKILQCRTIFLTASSDKAWSWTIRFGSLLSWNSYTDCSTQSQALGLHHDWGENYSIKRKHLPLSSTVGWPKSKLWRDAGTWRLREKVEDVWSQSQRGEKKGTLTAWRRRAGGHGWDAMETWGKYHHGKKKRGRKKIFFQPVFFVGWDPGCSLHSKPQGIHLIF